MLGKYEKLEILHSIESRAPRLVEHVTNFDTKNMEVLGFFCNSSWGDVLDLTHFF